MNSETMNLDLSELKRQNHQIGNISKSKKFPGKIKEVSLATENSFIKSKNKICKGGSHYNYSLQTICLKPRST